MRIAVTGKTGQVVTALKERAEKSGVQLAIIGRPELDLQDEGTVLRTLEAAAPHVIISAAAYTLVDKAEVEPELAYAVNRDGAGLVASAAATLRVPLIHLSTDYVFDGRKDSPYNEDDQVGPLGVYGASKLAGEVLVREATADHAIMRTAWIYSPFGNNFVKTMLRLAGERSEVRVVADQLGCPTSALDIANALLAVAANLNRSDEVSLRGTFHLAGSGETHWAAFAETIFECSRSHGGPAAKVVPIATSDYPTAAIRPANSRLDTAKLSAVHGVSLPDWRVSMRETMELLVGPHVNKKTEVAL